MKLTKMLMLMSVASVLAIGAGGQGALAQADAAKPAAPAAKDEPKKDEPKKDDKAGGGGGQETKNVAEEKLVFVRMTTSKGDVILELNAEKAPLSVKNFMSYVDKKYYDNTIFHRVIPGFMVQGGGFVADGGGIKEKGGQDKPIKNEWQNGLKNEKGTLAMARTMVADSATSQFFINVENNKFLDEPRDGAAYAVFGRVLSGMEVVNEIVKVKTTNKGPHQNVPVEAVTIVSMVKITADEAKKGK